MLTAHGGPTQFRALEAAAAGLAVGVAFNAWMYRQVRCEIELEHDAVWMMWLDWLATSLFWTVAIGLPVALVFGLNAAVVRSIWRAPRRTSG
jgi:hypothetical protein